MARRNYLNGPIADGVYTSELLNADYPDFQLALINFIDGAGNIVTPTAGTVTVTISADGVNFVNVKGGKFNAADAYNPDRPTPFYSGLVAYFRVELSGVVGAVTFNATAWLADSDQDVPTEVSNRGDVGVSVFVQDQTTPPLSVSFAKERTVATLSADTVVDTRVVQVLTGHGAVAGDTLELADANSNEFMQSVILSTTATSITISDPITRVFTTADSVAVVSTKNMLVDGSITPQVFSILPLPAQAGDIVRVIFEIVGTSGQDVTTFGSDPALTVGCTLRVKRSDGTYRNLFNVKRNSDIIRQAFDKSFDTNIGNNSRSFSSRVTYGGQSKHGVVIRLDGSLGEELQIVIQDDLTGGDNTSFVITAQGHELQ